MTCLRVQVAAEECGKFEPVISDIGLPDGLSTQLMSTLRRLYNLRVSNYCPLDHCALATDPIARSAFCLHRVLRCQAWVWRRTCSGAIRAESGGWYCNVFYYLCCDE